jgi:hypothetical protein
MSPSTFTQYQKLQAKKWWSEVFPKDEVDKKELHCDNDYFDTYQDLPVETGDHFFDEEEEGFDLEPDEKICDIRNLDSIYKSRTVVECTEGTEDSTGRDSKHTSNV